MRDTCTAGAAEHAEDDLSGIRTPDCEPMYATSRLLTVRSREELERVSQKARYLKPQHGGCSARRLSTLCVPQHAVMECHIC